MSMRDVWPEKAGPAARLRQSLSRLGCFVVVEVAVVIWALSDPHFFGDDYFSWKALVAPAVGVAYFARRSWLAWTDVRISRPGRRSTA